jgi:ABC-type amino acid transport system permease subunit
MILHILGSVGLGLVCGWLLAGTTSFTSRVWRGVVKVVVGIAALWLLTFLFFGWRELLWLSGALMIGSWLHLALRLQLAKRT